MPSDHLGLVLSEHDVLRYPAPQGWVGFSCKYTKFNMLERDSGFSAATAAMYASSCARIPSTPIRGESQ